MNTLPASSSPELISALASKLVQFLAQKHAMGYRYRDEGRALRELDRFLDTRLLLLGHKMKGLARCRVQLS
jgi:hypothetical protein